MLQIFQKHFYVGSPVFAKNSKKINSQVQTTQLN